MHTIQLSWQSFSYQFTDSLSAFLPRIPWVVLALLGGILVVRIIGRGLKFVLTLTAVQPALRSVITSTVEIALWIFLAIKMLELIGFTGIIVFFTGSIAAIGLAMAAGGSTLIADIIAGIFLARDEDFAIGDEVIVGETPTQGAVESMDARRVRIRDKDGVLHIIPNSVVERKEWVVVEKRPEVNALSRAVKTVKKVQRVALERRAEVIRYRAAGREKPSDFVKTPNNKSKLSE